MRIWSWYHLKILFCTYLEWEEKNHLAQSIFDSGSIFIKLPDIVKKLYWFWETVFEQKLSNKNCDMISTEIHQHLLWQQCGWNNYNTNSMPLFSNNWNKDNVVNSLWPIDVIWWHKTRSSLVQVMVCCLTAPSHDLNSYYLNPCWCIAKWTLWNKVQWNLNWSKFLTIKWV